MAQGPGRTRAAPAATAAADAPSWLAEKRRPLLAVAVLASLGFAAAVVSRNDSLRNTAAQVSLVSGMVLPPAILLWLLLLRQLRLSVDREVAEALGGPVAAGAADNPAATADDDVISPLDIGFSLATGVLLVAAVGAYAGMGAGKLVQAALLPGVADRKAAGRHTVVAAGLVWCLMSLWRRRKLKAAQKARADRQGQQAGETLQAEAPQPPPAAAAAAKKRK